MENTNENLPPNPVQPLTPQPQKWYAHKGLLVIIILAVIAGVSVWAYFTYNQPKDSAPITVNHKSATISPSSAIITSSSPESLYPVPAGWKDYHNEVLGLSFSYSPKWGDMSNYPNGNITNLKTLGQDNNFTANSYLDYIRLNFSKSGPVVKMYSEQYGGETYLSPPYGPIDNLLTLKPTDSACNYKIDYQRGDSLQEIFNDCRDGIKISVIENVQHFSPPTGFLYTYSLSYYGYKRLQNGSFDYLLTSYTATSTRQQTLRLTADQFLKQAGVTQGNYPNFPEFATFVQTLKSYSPPMAQTPTFTIPAGEDPNITLIRKYYYLLATGQFNDAYQFLASPTSSQQKFQQDNQNIYKIQPRNFKQLTTNQYELWVDYQEHNKDAQQQRLIVEIINGKIKQDLFETLTSSVATFGNMVAYGASRGSKDIVVLKQGDSESIIDSAANNFDQTLETLIFVDVSFSPKGDYLLYTAGGWEWSFLRVYDIANKKQVLQTDGGHGEFNPSESIYFFCDKNDMGGNYEASVYQVPGFTVKLDLLKKFPDLNSYADVSCSADQQNHNLQFKFTGKYDKNQNYDENAVKIYNVNLDTGELIN